MPLRARTIVLLLLLLAAAQAVWAAGAAGSRVAVNGTEMHGRTVEVRTTTDADGRYTTTGSTQDAQDAGVLDRMSGACPVMYSTHGLPLGSQCTTPEDPAATRALDSDADPRTGRASVSLARQHVRAGDRLGVTG